MFTWMDECETFNMGVFSSIGTICIPIHIGEEKKNISMYI